MASFVVVENVNPFGDGSSCLVLGGVCQILLSEAYSVAGEIGFSWWLVEHYSAYHIDCPDGCVSGEPARGRKDPPYFQMGYGSFYYIPDLVDSFVESPLPA